MKRSILLAAFLFSGCAVQAHTMQACKTACAPLGISWVSAHKCACNDPPKHGVDAHDPDDLHPF